MPQHIGIVACSAEGASLCYRTLCAEGAAPLGAHAHPEISMHSFSLADYVDCLERGDLQGLAELMLASAEKLTGIGADFLICPDNTVHQAFAFVAARSPRPWLHIAEAVVAEASTRGFSRVGLMGTRWLVDSNVYAEKVAARNIALVCPDPGERIETHRIIMDELVRGVFRTESLATLQGTVSRMRRDGCEAVILGCTELPLILNHTNAPLPVLDSTRLLARAALRRAIGDVT